MNNRSRAYSIDLPSRCMRCDAQQRWPASGTSVPGLEVARRIRERVLAVLAFVMLIVAWDATLRLDERIAPPRMRVSHGVEREVSDVQAQAWMP